MTNWGIPAAARADWYWRRIRNSRPRSWLTTVRLADPFMLRAAYEHTHASNNYHAARRYANLLDDRAVASFIDVTHNAYYERLKPLFGQTVQAMFTDEPSLIAVNIGQIPEEVRQRVKVDDPDRSQCEVVAARSVVLRHGPSDIRIDTVRT